MSSTPSVLVAVDVTDDEAPVLEARDYSDELGAQLLVVHVARPKARGPSELEVTSKITAIVTQHVGRRPDAVYVREGDPGKAIVQLADELRPLLLIVGRPRRDALLDRARHALRGTIALQVARRASGNVLIAQRTAAANGPVLAVTDLSDPARPAIVQALREASMRRAQVVVLHVVEAYMTTFQALERTRDRARSYLSAAVAGAKSAPTLLLRTGSLDVALEDAVARLGPQLVVVGRRGRAQRPAIFRTGAVDTVLGIARGSVLVVPLGLTTMTAAPPSDAAPRDLEGRDSRIRR
jgi:nucleotide-binding universal stress UspA family protein